jgi:hypothetical protein
MPPLPIALRGVISVVNTVLFLVTGTMAYMCFMYGSMAPNTAERDWVVKLGIMLTAAALYIAVVG